MSIVRRSRPVPDRETVLRKLRAAVPDLRERYGVRSLALFGSFARGKPRPGSDLDLLVEFDDRPLTLLQFVALENELTDLLGVEVDLVERQVLKPHIGRRILEELVGV